MPIYEYQCSNCGHQLEAMQKFSENPLVDCPHCGKASLTKLISASGFQLKGTGWYVTDYSKKGQTSAKTSTESTKTETKANESTVKTETKTSDGSQ